MKVSNRVRGKGGQHTIELGILRFDICDVELCVHHRKPSRDRCLHKRRGFDGHMMDGIYLQVRCTAAGEVDVSHCQQLGMLVVPILCKRE